MPASDGRRWLAPEVVQTSAMDCGPAALKCLLEGYNVPVSYGRLREACQTDVDGTSIDTLEQVAVSLGLDASQVMIPADHMLLPDQAALPALVVVKLPDGMTHFVVVWRLHGRWVQIMDPTRGRRWQRREKFLADLYRHRQPVPASDWREWADSAEFLLPVQQRLSLLGFAQDDALGFIEATRLDPGWQGLATLDAAIRLVALLVSSKALETGSDAEILCRDLFSSAHNSLAANGIEAAHALIPADYWSIAPLPDNPENSDETWLLLSGAVLIQTHGTQPQQTEAMPAELAAALTEEPNRPEVTLFNLLRQDGLLTPFTLLAALALATFGVMVEALLFRGLLQLGQAAHPGDFRFVAVAAVGLFLAIIVLLEFPMTNAEARIGRRLENRLRMWFMEKVPKLNDRYFSSRLTSDMAHRVYELRELRHLPQLALQFLRTNFELLLTTIGLIWIHPGGAWIALFALLVTLGIWLGSQPVLIEQDLNLRTHEGALSRFYLDALLGLTPVRTHGAERSIRRQHEGMLVQWVRASMAFYRTFVGIQAIAAICGVGFAVWLLHSYIQGNGPASGMLLLFYWALRLPALGQELAQTLRQYPMHRNRVLRLLEPLGATEEVSGQSPRTATDPTPRTDGVAINMRNLEVFAGGHPILRGIDLEIPSGEHLAVVGPSGAGKSSLVGLLLGWHRPVAGSITVDGMQLDGETLTDLRRETAWVDPAVQLWNRSLLGNLRYGNDQLDSDSMNAAITDADLFGVLERLPDGLQTTLGEGGGLVSGGEGQRVRLGRAMLRTPARLVILDEPFRGLDRGQRTKLLQRARKHWPDATLIFISHDVGDSQDFDRVLVIDDGVVREDGHPADLAKKSESLYRRLLDAESLVRKDLWASDEWRRLRLDAGTLTEENARNRSS